MLNNPKWDIDHLIGWLETKPADEEYNYTDGAGKL
jgi:hypothetical protein